MICYYCHIEDIKKVNLYLCMNIYDKFEIKIHYSTIKLSIYKESQRQYLKSNKPE